MKKIFKYELTASIGKQTISIPSEFNLLSVQNQGIKISLWALCDTESDVIEKDFFIYATGDAVNDKHKYVATCKLFHDSLIYHIFSE